jgi:glycosyltransferase involved in cell wall biosynthesis
MATLYCQPSLWEGFPNAMAEAMAAGVIPVGFKETSGVRDLITDSKNGIICESPSTSDSLALGLDRAICSPDELAGLSESAAQVSSEYSIARWEEAWEGVLKL